MSNNNISLAAMVRRISRLVENAFNKGHLPMTWLVDMPTKGIVVMVTPIWARSAEEAAEVKDDLADAMCTLFKEHGVTRYARASECWTAPGDCQRPSEHPQRREIVFIEADDGHELLIAIREIVRPVGGKPYLTKLVIGHPKERGVGRFLNLLPPATVH